jgi:cell filamentation protein
MNDDPYVYPGTNVLKNNLDIRNTDELQRAEIAITRTRIMQPMEGPLSLTPQDYQDLHHHIFQDIYPWAGEFRTVDIAKGHSQFCRPDFIDAQMQQRFQEIRQENNLNGLHKDAFAERAGFYVSEINAIHPFREGNGRTQRYFLEQLAQQAGHYLDVSRMDKDQWINASIKSFHEVKHEPFVKVIRSTLLDREQIREEKKKD